MCLILPESRQSCRIAGCKLLKGGDNENGPAIAIKRVPVMYRLLENIPDSPKNNRLSARATANEAALKRDEPAGKSVVGTVETTTVHTIFWEASDQRRTPNATPLEWRLCVLGDAELAEERFRWKYATKVDLPAGVAGCTIRFAYQAADAGHPRGAEQARRRARKLRRQVQTLLGCRRRKLPIGSALSEESADLTLLQDS